MYKDGTELRLAATDVSNHLACRHLTELDRSVAEGRRKAPDFRDPMLAVLQQRGFEHERAYLAHLRASGRKVTAPEVEGGKIPAERAVEAMAAGADAIFQAELHDGRWYGRADVLLKVAAPSAKWAWSYEVTDTKLSQETRAGTVLQLCLYTDLVSHAGPPPEYMHVVKPGADFLPRAFGSTTSARTTAWCGGAWRRSVAAPPSESTVSAARCPLRHLPLAAGLRCPPPRGRQPLPRRGDPAPPRRRAGAPGHRDPAAVRARSRSRPGTARARKPGGITRARMARRRSSSTGGTAGRAGARASARAGGVRILPASRAGCGRHFLRHRVRSVCRRRRHGVPAGVRIPGGRGQLPTGRYGRSARPRSGEALEAFIDFVMERWQAHPGMHIYHFSPYEPAAVKRLVGRHGTREEELDRLLRAERFVDLLAVTRQGLRVSVESYSLKSLESSFGFPAFAGAAAGGRRAAARCVGAGAGGCCGGLRGGPGRGGGLQPRRLPVDCRAAGLAGGAARGAGAEGAFPAAREQERGCQRGGGRARRGRPGGLRPPDGGASGGPRNMGGRGARPMAPCPPAGVFPPRGKVRLVGVLPHPRPGARGPAGRAQGGLGASVCRQVRAGAASPVHRYTFPEQEAAFWTRETTWTRSAESEVGKGKVFSSISAPGSWISQKYNRFASVHPASVMINDRVHRPPWTGRY